MDIRLSLLKLLYKKRMVGDMYISPFSYKNLQNKNSLILNANTNLMLSDICKDCSLCSLNKYRKKNLFSSGNGKSGVFIVLPEANKFEVNSGEFYSGRSGEMLKNMIINVLKIDIKDVYLTTLIKCSSPSNREPNYDEISKCFNYLYKQIELIKPKIVILVGSDRYKDIDKSEVFTKLKERGNREIMYKTFEIYHPNEIIKNPSLRQKTFNMLKCINENI